MTEIQPFAFPATGQTVRTLLVGDAPTSYSHPRTGDRMASSQVRVTPKGLKELRARLAGQQQLVVIEGGA